MWRQIGECLGSGLSYVLLLSTLGTLQDKKLTAVNEAWHCIHHHITMLMILQAISKLFSTWNFIFGGRSFVQNSSIAFFRCAPQMIDNKITLIFSLGSFRKSLCNKKCFIYEIFVPLNSFTLFHVARIFFWQRLCVMMICKVGLISLSARMVVCSIPFHL